MDEIINIVTNISNDKKQNMIYGKIIIDLYTNKINLYSVIIKDNEFILHISIPLISIDPLILFKYYIYFQHSKKEKYYNIFSKTFNKFDKIKYIIYYKNETCKMCFSNYHEKLKKNIYKEIDNEVAIDILKYNNIYTSKVISIYLESFLEKKDIFYTLNDICEYIKNTFEIKN
jgi:NADH:ubiquinone oxidoreductase subunit 5 (subunit L)/multisubunit Na+/H+ antiporter MnhA subunit